MGYIQCLSSEVEEGMGMGIDDGRTTIENVEQGIHAWLKIEKEKKKKNQSNPTVAIIFRGHAECLDNRGANTEKEKKKTRTSLFVPTALFNCTGMNWAGDGKVRLATATEDQ